MRIVKLSAAILAALFLSATAAAATITQEGSGIGKDGEIKVKVVFEDGKSRMLTSLNNRKIRSCLRKYLPTSKTKLLRNLCTKGG